MVEWLSFVFLFVSGCVSVREYRAECPNDMVRVSSTEQEIDICVDKYEWGGTERRLEKRTPIGYHTFHDCFDTCQKQGKRLLKHEEWLLAADGTNPQMCNIHREHPILRLLGRDEPWMFEGIDCKNPKETWRSCMADPRINRMPKTVARNDEFPGCVSSHGVHNMVGNLGEWIDEIRPNGEHPLGRFNGGLYPQPKSSPRYSTTVHRLSYRDYSLGCRCALDSSGR